MITWIALSAAHAADLQHTVGLRYRHGVVPNGILDLWFFDSDDPEALPYDRPKVSANVFGLEYTLGMSKSGGPKLQAWVERWAFPLDAGYWDDEESPADHTDGDWVEPDGLGAWAIGFNFAQEIALSSTTAPVWVGLGVGGGLGLGFSSGTLTVWHPGYHQDSLDPDCLHDAVAPDRHDTCGNDGTIDMPGTVPIVDLTFGPVVHLTEHAMVRIDLGVHDFLYGGVAAGGSF
ncbi:MAG: hypothetical protein ABMB14_29920 [Myxococcota bacterium]